MAYCHAVFFVFLHYGGVLDRFFKEKCLPRCRSPPYAPKIWNSETYQIFGGLTVVTKCFYIAFHKYFFNPPNRSAVYLLSLSPESDGRGPKHDPNWAPAKVAGSAVRKTARYLRQSGAWIPCCQFDDPPWSGDPYLLVSHWDCARPLWWRGQDRRRILSLPQDAYAQAGCASSKAERTVGWRRPHYAQQHPAPVHSLTAPSRCTLANSGTSSRS